MHSEISKGLIQPDCAVADKCPVAVDSDSVGMKYEQNDRLLVRGHVRAFIDDGESVRLHHAKHNLVVNRGRRILAHLLATGSANYAIATMHWGIGGHASGDILTPIPPTVADTALEIDMFTKAVNGYSFYPEGEETTVMFTTVLEKTQGNGDGVVPYTEAGMFTAAGEMFARETFPAIVKTPKFRIIFEWTFLF